MNQVFSQLDADRRDEENSDVPVMERIRRRILSGEFAPNQRLIESELCQDYNASRLVVRIALQNLASDGLVELQKNRGARVRAISREEAIEIVEVRKALEGLSAARAAQLATAADRAELEEIAAEMRTAVESGAVLNYAQLSSRLHEAIQRISNNQTCAKMLDRLNAQMVRHQFSLILQPGRAAVSLGYHEQVVQAISRADSVEAEKAMRQHLESLSEELSHGI
jgi:DNA-binding GntR family transcriptional regulator